jgi:hypothetical protein
MKRGKRKGGGNVEENVEENKRKENIASKLTLKW